MISEIKSAVINRVKSKTFSILSILSIFLPLVFVTQAAASSIETYPIKDPAIYFSQIKENDQTGLALKAKPVYARLAKAGEVITTKIVGAADEQQSPAAQKGDWVVEVICPATGNEQRLLAADKFNQGYGEPFTSLNKPGYLRVVPQSVPQRYYVVPESEGTFVIATTETAKQRVKPGDILLQSTDNSKTVSWVRESAFPCSYEIMIPAKNNPPKKSR